MAPEFEPNEVIQVGDLAGYGPLTLGVGQDDDGSFIAVEVETDQYGHAGTPEAALQDLGDTLTEYHAFLRSHGPERLSFHLQQHLQFLDSQFTADSQAARSIAV